MPAWAAAADAPFLLPPSSSAVSSTGMRSRPLDSKLPLSSSSSSKGFPCTIHSRAGFQINNNRTRCLKVKAQKNSGDSRTRIAPLQFESPTGQLLSQIIQSHPHLLPATIDQQLETLQSDKDAQAKESANAPQDLLYKRIAEVKDKERQKALEEIIYCWILYKFVEHGISMVPAISATPDSVRDIISLPNQENKLQSIHSPDAVEMIESHYTHMFGEKIIPPLDPVVEISSLGLGKLYAASIMYGYFLKRVDERFQLEKNMNTLSPSPMQQIALENLKPNPFWDLESLVQISPDGDEGSLGNGEGSKSNRLRSYVTDLDAETLQRYATIRSKEAVSLIEKQTQALFGRPDIKVLDDGTVNAKDGKMLTLSFTELRMIVLEAVAFGSFLWEAEGYVESKYHFVKS